MLDKSQPLDIAIRGRDGLGSSRQVFFGDKDIFDDSRSVKALISVGSGDWQIAARPKQGWIISSRNIWILCVAGVTTAALLLLLSWIRSRQISKNSHYRQKIQQSESLLQNVGKMALIGGWKIDSDAKLCLLSPQAAQTLGLEDTGSHVSFEKVQSVIADADASELNDKIKQSIRHSLSFEIELPITLSSGIHKWVKIIGNTDKLDDRRFRIIGAIQDITERKQYIEVIQKQANYDLLTGLPNCLLFINRLDKAIATAKRHNRKITVLFIDLDNFKLVNDHLGHQAGDTVLKQFGERIGRCIRESDTLARYSGDEFTIILPDLDSDLAPLNVAENILGSVNRPFHIAINQIYCGASIGISIYPNDGDSADELVSNADHAMYEVKNNGLNDWRYFTAAMQADSEKRHVLRTNLAAAISAQELEVYYQPIIELSTKPISKCEALVRWTDKARNSIPTDEFISVAEESGMINEIDRFVLKTASEFLIQQNRINNQRVGRSVNVSPRLFSAKDKSLHLWLDLVIAAAKNLDLTVEITERLLTQDSIRVLETLAKLKSAGIEIAIDDFGTGYSSLRCLTLFPIDVIKIDGSFINNIDKDHATCVLTDAIISLAEKLSLEVIAEGVETENQLNYLRQRGCKYAQGYLLGRPQNEQIFLSLLESEILNCAS